MISRPPLTRAISTVFVVLALSVTFAGLSWGQDRIPPYVDEVAGKVRLLSLEPNGTRPPYPVEKSERLRTGDQVQTLEDSKATVWLKNRNPVRMGELSLLEVLPEEGSNPLMNLLRGAVYFFNRDKAHETRIRTPHGTAAPLGTEFSLTVDDTGARLEVFDGVATLSNSFGMVSVRSMEYGTMNSNSVPVVRPLLATNVVQWWLYYPAVLDLADLGLSPDQSNRLASTIDAYRSGDLPKALRAYPGYPKPSEPDNAAERTFLAGLYLGAGQVGKAEGLLAGVGTNSSPVMALRWLIASVRGQVGQAPEVHTSPSEWLGVSYYYQARHELEQALAAAKTAVERSPRFAFGRLRVAELEFGFRRSAEAEAALRRSLELAPRNAQSHALNGFILSSQNRFREAEAAFETAKTLDPSLGNAWLGSGLLRIRKGEVSAGLNSLQTAVILEPNRALLRSYLAKAFADAGDDALSFEELERSIGLDKNDPTPWLYSALVKRDINRANEAVGDLERSITLNDNRAVYRGRSLLDEDRAVRSSSLAGIYRNAGLDDVSLRTAAKAVSDDYANYSAHLFLAESYNTLRDPTAFNLRYETAWLNELLLANLLSPVGGTPLSQQISQNEYSRLFQRDGAALSSFSEYRSDGQFRESAAQSGVFGNTGWSLDLIYQHNDGVRPNNDLDRINWYTTVKQQLSQEDSVLLLVEYQSYHSGDNFQRYDQSLSRTNYSFDEFQQPNLLAGYHHEWAPGIHTLILAGRLENDQRFSDRDAAQTVLFLNTNGTIASGASLPYDVTYRSQFEIFTGEINHLVQSGHHTLIAGARFQMGEFETSNQLTPSASVPFFLLPFFPASSATTIEPFERQSAYGYYSVEALDKLKLTAGLAYDRLRFPGNQRQVPISAGSQTRDRVSPKAALVWELSPKSTIRGIYSQSLGGASFDESFRLEPSQLAGFNQSFRTLIPESIVGSVSAPEHDVAGLALDLKLSSRLFLGFDAGWLSSLVRQDVGAFGFYASVPPQPPASVTSMAQRLDYEEGSVGVSVNWLASNEWSVGGRYRYVRSDLDTTYPGFHAADSSEAAGLHQATTFVLYDHPSGFFARAEANWYHQGSAGYSSPLENEDFWQSNVFVGWRLHRQRGEISLGVMNLNDADYRLNPLTSYSEQPRERVMVARLGFRF